MKMTHTIVDIHPKDAYHSARSTFIGKKCAFVKAVPHRENDGWWACTLWLEGFRMRPRFRRVKLERIDAQTNQTNS